MLFVTISRWRHSRSYPRRRPQGPASAQAGAAKVAARCGIATIDRATLAAWRAQAEQRSLYLLDDEWAAEIANRTMRGVMHIGWVPDGEGGYRGQLAVYVRPNGLLGTGYMAAIRPFRHRIVYPRMLRQIGRAWQTSAN